MGTCLSKKKDASLSVSSKTVAVDPVKPDNNTQKVAQKQQPRKSEEEEGLVKKEIFVIKHRKSHEQKEASVVEEEMGNNVTKEEVDAILIQCGRLSRSNSSETGKSRKYSGSKRSYDFDHNDVDHADDDSDSKKKISDEDDEQRQHRQRHRQSSPSSQGRRRRTPSREREQQSSGRRVSRSPGRRSETNKTVTNSNRPGKMVSVPANANGSINRISVKRNAASPRSQSPARANANQQQPPLSRSSSRKAEHSPYRRNPLSEIDPNSLTNANRVQTEGANQGGIQKPDKTSNRGGNKVVITNCIEREHQRTTGNSVVSLTTPSGAENHQKPQTVTRSRSSRLSRDLDINPETLMNPSPSYTTLLLEDIHNFHQKNNNTPSISLPACVSKACSILEAVADLNSSTTTSNLALGKKMPESNYRDPFVESEVLGSDDLMEPSFHKYVTVRRGGTTLQGVDLDDQESSGSNSVAGGSQQNRSFSSSSWEPNSAESTDRWTSRSNTRDQSPLGFQRSETGCDARKTKKRDNDYEKKAGIGRGRIGTGKVPVGVAAST